MGAKTKAADRIVGAHFFSPAHIMPLLEIVRTKNTSKQVGLFLMRGACVFAGGGVKCGRAIGIQTGASPKPNQDMKPKPQPQVILDTLALSSVIKKTPVVVGNCTGGLGWRPLCI